MLVELCHRWDHNLEVKLKERLSGQKFKKMRESIIHLVDASGEDGRKAKSCESIKEMLDIFSVGTEKAKIFHPVPSEDELIPLRLMNLCSNNKAVKCKMNQAKKRMRMDLTSGGAAIDDDDSSRAEVARVVENATEIEGAEGASVVNASETEASTRTAIDNNEVEKEAEAHEEVNEYLAAGQAAVEILKKNAGNSLVSIPCDFCKMNGVVAPLLSNHVCRFATPSGSRMIEGDGNNRICGLAFCIFCREKWGTNEGGNFNDSRCCHHHPSCAGSSSAPTSTPAAQPRTGTGENSNTAPVSTPATQPLRTGCSTTTSAPAPTTTKPSRREPAYVEKEQEDDIFVPDYVRVKSCIDALEKMHDAEESTSPGNSLLKLRATKLAMQEEATRRTEQGVKAQKEWEKAFLEASERGLRRKKH